jgi:hypothetical protein
MTVALTRPWHPICHVIPLTSLPERYMRWLSARQDEPVLLKMEQLAMSVSS